MRVDITIDIADVEHLVREEVARRLPNCELGDLIVKSWNTDVFMIVGGKLAETGHVVCQERREFK
jgi:hypothetical protein